jgi:quinol monooxygenase YgiN
MNISMSHLSICPRPRSGTGRGVQPTQRLVEAHEGFIDLQVWQSDRDCGEIVMVSRWPHRVCFKAHMKSADRRASHDRILPSLRAAIKLTSLQHMHNFEVVAA